MHIVMHVLKAQFIICKETIITFAIIKPIILNCTRQKVIIKQGFLIIVYNRFEFTLRYPFKFEKVVFPISKLIVD